MYWESVICIVGLIILRQALYRLRSRWIFKPDTTKYLIKGKQYNVNGINIYVQDNNKKFWVIFSQPLQGCAGHYSGIYGYLSSYYNVITYDYRGYGESTGSPNPENILEDGIIVAAFARNKLKIRTKRIILFGKDLGGAVAAMQAAVLNSEPEKIRGLFIQNLVPNLNCKFSLWNPMRWFLPNNMYTNDYRADAKCKYELIDQNLDAITKFIDVTKHFSQSA